MRDQQQLHDPQAGLGAHGSRALHGLSGVWDPDPHKPRDWLNADG
jgi:hypothetical protein